MTADRTHGLWRTGGRILTYAQIVSGLMGAIENAALLNLLQLGTGVVYIVIATIFGRRQKASVPVRIQITLA